MPVEEHPTYGKTALIRLGTAAPEFYTMVHMAEIELTVNGERRRLDVDPATPLLLVLRNDLGLRAAKYGCGLEQCGACTVLLGGEAAMSCRLPVGQLAGREVTTLEGLADGDTLHALQQAFIEEQAAQCGYCVPGILMSAAALLAWNEDPDDDAIRRQLSDHLCRCGAQPRILRAIKRAARMRTGA